MPHIVDSMREVKHWFREVNPSPVLDDNERRLTRHENKREEPRTNAGTLLAKQMLAELND